jgi:hypothetical protein
MVEVFHAGTSPESEGAVTAVVLTLSGAPEVLMVRADELAQSIFDDNELVEINWCDPDDVEELGNVILVAAFEQVSGRTMTTTDVPNVGHKPTTKTKRKRFPGWQRPDPAWMRRRLQDEVPRPSRYLADGLELSIFSVVLHLSHSVLCAHPSEPSVLVEAAARAWRQRRA